VSICDAPIISTVCTAVGEGPAGLFFRWVADAMGLAVSTLFQGMWEVFSTTTAVDITSDGYIRVYNILFGIAVVVTLLLFCFQLIAGLARRDPSALTRAGIGVAKSVLGSFVLITCTALLLQVTDLLSVGIMQAAGETIESMGDRLTLLIAGLTAVGSTTGAGALLMIFLAGLMIAAIFILWFSLLIRKALLLVAIVLGPIALAGLTWEASRGWFGKWATFVIALIASKLVVTVIFLVALTQVATPITLDLAVLSEPIAGIVLLFASFAPYVVYKFLAFVGFDMYQAASMEQEAKSALNRPVPVPSKPNTGQAKQVLDGAGSKGKPAASEPAPAPATAPAAPAEGTAAGGSAGGGTAGGAGGGAAAGGAAAAGPIVAGAMIVKEAIETAATAGPALGGAIGEVADGHAASAGESAPPPATAQAQQPPAVLPPSDTGSEG